MHFCSTRLGNFGKAHTYIEQEKEVAMGKCCHATSKHKFCIQQVVLRAKYKQLRNKFLSHLQSAKQSHAQSIPTENSKPLAPNHYESCELMKTMMAKAAKYVVSG